MHVRVHMGMCMGMDMGMDMCMCMCMCMCMGTGQHQAQRKREEGEYLQAVCGRDQKIMRLQIPGSVNKRVIWFCDYETR